MPGTRPFQSVRALRPGRSIFDLSYQKKFTCDMGKLIPIMCDEVVPGDVWEIANELVARCLALVAPVMHEVNVFVHYFFVPYRILDEDWESFITGGTDGDYAGVIPRWVPTNTAKGSLWDYLGFPTGVAPLGLSAPIDYPRRAYNRIYNEYYRDENLTSEVLETNETILNRAWEKDYFTSALPWQQRGTAPALPISGTTTAVFAGNIDAKAYWSGEVGTASKQLQNQSTTGTSTAVKKADASTNPATSEDILARVLKTSLDNNTVNLSSASTFDVADLRLAFQIQKWMERSARGGARYTETLQSHFGVSPRDERLQRPEYIGGSKSPLIVSEVLQTSETATTPQGNLAGHGLAVDRKYCAKYHAVEFGLIMGIMSIMPRTAYQQGIDRQWLRRSKFDFYWPEFANLSEQAIEMEEIYAVANEATNRGIFGYQGHYDELRTKRDMVCSDMRDTFAYWHLGRIFGAAPALNSAFVVSDPSKRIFADQADPGLMVNFGNIIRAARPLPIESDPGLVDHH